jgi:hypothetical protein
MKKLVVLSVSLLAGIISCTAQKTQDRPVSAFQKLKISGSVSVLYTNSDTLNLKVSADENELEGVVTKVENGILIIENKGTYKSPVTIYLRNNHLTNIETAGATSFKITNTIKEDSLDVSVSGASRQTINGDIKKINCFQNGASSLVVSGKSDMVNLTLSGASVFKGYNLTATNANVIATGASSAKVFVTDKLKASASGASSVKIKGEPKDVTAEATPAASITRVNKQSANNDNGSDTTIYNWKSKKVLVIKKEGEWEEVKQKKKQDKDDFKHWTGFSVGVNGYFNPTGGLNLAKNYKYMDLNYSRSFNFQFNLFEKQFNLAKNHVKIITGFGFDYHSYALSNKTKLNADSSFTWGTIDSSNTYSYKKNKLRNTYIQVPLLLEFNTSNNPNKSFHLAFGVIGEFLISGRTKQSLEELKANKADVTRVRKDNYNMSPFAAKAHVNFGYKGWTLFGEYNLTPLFESGKGPELYPFTAGIRIVPFT